MVKYIKEMKYYSDKPWGYKERIAEGEYKGFDFYVLNLGTHPCAYIDVSETELAGKYYDDINIDCHCGITYACETLATVDKSGWFIGWDYAHIGDFVSRTTYFDIEGRRWTTEEIVVECKMVIDQICEILESDKCNE